MDFRKILEDQFRGNGYPVIADGVASGRMAMVDEIECMKKVREATIEECANIAEDACLVPPDGGSPTPAEYSTAMEAAARIRALRTNHL